MTAATAVGRDVVAALEVTALAEGSVDGDGGATLIRQWLLLNLISTSRMKRLRDDVFLNPQFKRPFGSSSRGES
ncbi:hypothetical protein SASPL_126485 [Salvia splendens]|uniref:Uncharacterized protein n=1 Tax=Salvia splendens TaxID=180675 RepID=A0A8X8ZR73_SALSN|nr:hypothetical protein SASPL_126485 [Salvia splendens]